MIKKAFAKFALERGFTAHYSGKQKKHFLRPVGFGMDIHALINKKQPTL